MAAHDNIAEIVRVVHIAAMSEEHWDEQLKRAVRAKPKPEKPE